MKKPLITTLQLFMMVMGSALVFPYSYMPILSTPNANQDIWIVLLLAIVYIIIINAPLLYLINKFRGLSLNQMVETILGKYIGKPVLMIYVFFFLYCCISCSLITSHYMNSFLFLNTPNWALLIFLIVPVTYASYKGAGTIGRLAVFIVPFVMLTILFFLFFGASNFDMSVFKPILADSTFSGLNLSAFLTATRFSEILIFLVFSYYLNKKVRINKTYMASLFAFCVCYMLILVPTVSVLGVDFAKMSWNPYYVYTRQVNAFSFLERLQAFNTLAWFPVTILKLTIYNFMACRVFSSLFNVRSHKKFVIPISTLCFIVGIVPFLNNSGVIKILSSDKVFPWVMLPVIVVLPCILILIYLVRKKKLTTVIVKAQSSANKSEE